jgi:hypothetical protein
VSFLGVFAGVRGSLGVLLKLDLAKFELSSSYCSTITYC